MNGTYAERREKPRIVVRPPASNRSTEPAPYRLVDISCSGCLVESLEPLGEVASGVRLSLPLPKRAAKNKLIATIVRKSEGKDREERAGLRYGLRFEEMDPVSHNTLNLYLDYLRRDAHIAGLDEAWRRLRAGTRVPS